MEDREHEAEVARDRRLPREQKLHRLLRPQVHVVDVVVERDHLVGELGIPGNERLDCGPHRAEDELGLDVEQLLELAELLLERRS